MTDPCPRLAEDIASDMAERAAEILRGNRETELADLEVELVARYGFTRDQVEAGAARALSVARQRRIDEAIKPRQRRAGPYLLSGTVVRLPVTGGVK